MERALRNPLWSTIRWRSPRSLRAARFRELLGKTKHKELLSEKFIDALEKRRDLLESRKLKALAFQAPLFLLLVFAMLEVNVHVSILGLTVESARNLREVVIVISALFALALVEFDLQLRHLEDMLKGVVDKQAGDDEDLKQFLRVRYGLGSATFFSTYDKDLNLGWAQWISAGLLLVGWVSIFAVAFAIAGFVQLFTLYQIYLKPNFSTDVSIGVIAFVCVTEAAVLLYGAVQNCWQPYRTLEDWLKLDRLREGNPAKYNEVIQGIVRRHSQKGLFGRLFTRPKMLRIKD